MRQGLGTESFSITQNGTNVAYRWGHGCHMIAVDGMRVVRVIQIVVVVVAAAAAALMMMMETRGRR